MDALIYVLNGTKRVRVAGHFPGSRVTLDKATRGHPFFGKPEGLLVGLRIESHPNVPLLRALWSLLDGIWGLLKGSWGVLE